VLSVKNKSQVLGILAIKFIFYLFTAAFAPYRHVNSVWHWWL